MRKFFGKQGWNRVLSVVLVMVLVAGTVGMNEMFVKAGDVVYPAGVPTVATGGFVGKTSGTVEDVVQEQVQQGVKISLPANSYSRAHSQWCPRVLSDGYRVDIEDFAIAENESLLMVLGPTSSGDYFDNTNSTQIYGIIYETDGDFVIMSAASGGKLNTTGTVLAASTLTSMSLIDKLSIYIQSDGAKWDIVVDTYKDGTRIGDSYTTSIATTYTQTYFNFGAVGYATITDATTATIKGWTNKSAASYMVSYTGIPVQSISLDRTELSLSKGGTGTLQATISPSTATDQSVSWSSSNEECVSIDVNGNITAKATTTEPVAITATAADGKTATCTVIVSAIVYPVGVPTIEGLNVAETGYGSKASYEDIASNGIHQGVRMTFEANGYQRLYSQYRRHSLLDGYYVEIEDFNVAENDSMLIVMGTASDSYITTTTETYGFIYEYDGDFVVMSATSGKDLMNGGVIQSAVKLAAQNDIDKLSVYVKSDGTKWNFVVNTYKNGAKVGETYTTSVATSATETYFSFGAVNSVTVMDATTATIKSWTNKSALSYMVSYMAPAVKSIVLDKEFRSLLVDESTNLTAMPIPSDASPDVNWSSADETIATVNADGTVTAVKAGTTIITATSKTDEDMAASCVVKVTNPTEYITTDMLSNSGSWPTVENITEGIKVSYSADTASWRRIDGAYNDNLKHGYWLEGNGVHVGLKDIELANDSDAIAVFIGDGLKSSGVHDSLWYDAEEGGYMLFYSKGGSFSIVKIVKTAKTETVLVSEKREALGDRLSLDIRLEDGKYEFSVNGKTYSIPGVPSEDAACPISNDSRVYFSFGLVPGFGVTDGVVTGPNFGATTYGSDGTFTLTNISHVTTEELTLPVYSQQATLKGFEGEYVIGGGDVALTTTLGMETFDGTPNDSKEDILWEVAAVDDVEDGYTVKQTGGTHYLNISGTGVSCSETAQTLYITRTRTTTAAYTTISDGTNYLCVSSEGVSASTTPDKLILYSVTPELSQATEKEPLFTLSAFADLHGERIYYNGEEYIRDGIIDATKKVGQNENANVIAFLGDLISSKSTSDAIKDYDGYWDYYQRGAEEKDRLSVLEQWQTARDAMYTAAASATKSGRALYLTGNHEFKIGSLNTSDNGGAFNSGDYTDGIQSHLPQLISGDNAYYQADWPEGTSEDIKAAGHVLSYYYNIDGMDILAINTTYTGTEITSGWNYDLGALEWMENKLEEIGEDKTVIVLGHYPTESLNNSVGQQSYTKIKSIFAKYPNVIYLTGHTHDPYIHTDTYERVQTFAKDAYTAFDNRYESPTGYIEAFAGSVAFTNDIGLSGCAEDGTPVVVQGLLVKVYSDRIVLQMKNYNESPLGVDALREYTIMRDVKLNIAEEPQEVETVEYTTAFANFRAGKEKEAPVAPKGYVFAGWYYDVACTKLVASETVNVEEDEQIFAKFLPQDVLSVKAQLKLAEGTTTDSAEGKTEMRLITTIDAKLDYQNVGFLINGKPYTCQYAYTSLKAAGFEKTPDVFNSCSKRFVTRNIINLSWNTTTKLVDRPIKVQAFWTTGDGTVIYGQERIITIKQGLDAIDSSGTADYSLR